MFTQDLKLIYDAPFGDKSTADKCQRRWKKILQNDENKIILLYDILLDGLAKLDTSNTEHLIHFFKFLEVFHKDEFFPSIYNDERREAFQSLIMDFLKRIIPYFPKLIALENVHITQTPWPWANKGNVSNLVSTVFEIYFCHSPLMEKSAKMEASKYVFDAIKAFPELGNNLVESLLEYHHDIVKAYSEIIIHTVQTHVTTTYDIKDNIALSLFSIYVESHQEPYKNLPKIIAAVLSQSKKWNNDQIDFFIQTYLLEPLSIGESKDDRLSKINDRIDWCKTNNKKEYLKEALKEKQEIEENYEKIVSNEWMKCYKAISPKKNIIKAIDSIIHCFPDHPKTRILKDLLKDIETFKNAPKVFDLNQKPSIKFQDFALKLMIIEELMYKQNKIEPKFDVHLFAQEYQKREIDVESEGYEPIKEAKKYFENLDIPQELLNTITHLSHYDCDVETYDNFWPFFDPGCEDPIKITNKAIEDLHYLPNLKIMRSLDLLNPSKKLIGELKKKNIELIPYEEV